MRRFILAALVATIGLALITSSARAENPGLADFDLATELKLFAKNLKDLGRVVELCESALEKGLDEGNAKLATQLLTATLYERAKRYCVPIFDKKPPSRHWTRYREMALKDLKKALQSDEDQGWVHHLIARLSALPGGDRDQAVESADKAVQLLAGTKEAIKRERSKALVLRAGLRQVPEERLADLNEAIETDEHNFDALRARGVHFLSQEKYDQALADLKQVIDKNHDDIAALQACAEAFVAKKQYDEAIARLDAIVKLTPDSVVGYLLRARIHALREDTQAMLDDLSEVLKIDPHNVMALLMRARTYLAEDKTAEAKTDVERILESRPRSAQAVLLRSLILAKEENYAAAIVDLKRIARADPENLDLKMQLAVFYSADKRPSKAIELYTEILGADEKRFEALRGRADARLAIGKQAEAITDYEAALKLDEDDTGVLNNFAWVLATSPDDKLRDGNRALELAKKACELTEYKKPHILSTLAAAYAESGDFDSAVQWSTKALELGEGEEMKEELQKELDTFKAKKPMRELQQTEEPPEPEPPSEEDLFID